MAKRILILPVTKHDLFGQLLREVQRIKSEGDYNAGKTLRENYGVSGSKLHASIRTEYFPSLPYSGFVNQCWFLI
jgi:dipeptidyl-peptidase-3